MTIVKIQNLMKIVFWWFGTVKYCYHIAYCSSVHLSSPPRFHLTYSTETKYSSIQTHPPALLQLSWRLTATQSAHQVAVECHMKPDKAKQPVLLNKLPAAIKTEKGVCGGVKWN